MGSVIAIVFLIARIILTIHIKVISFLIKRFDITNGLVAGSTFNILTANVRMNVWIRVVIVIAIIIGSVLLQHYFIVARIIFGALSSFFLGLIVYAILKDNIRFSPLIPSVIAAILVGLHNWFGWRKRLDINELTRE